MLTLHVYNILLHGDIGIRYRENHEHTQQTVSKYSDSSGFVDEYWHLLLIDISTYVLQSYDCKFDPNSFCVELNSTLYVHNTIMLNDFPKGVWRIQCPRQFFLFQKFPIDLKCGNWRHRLMN